jgi:prepilin signal peptidase PulO-like enzyme (type II secretory pathway)
LAGGISGFVFGLAWQLRKDASTQFPFGPPLLASLWLSLLYAEPALHWMEMKFS